MAKPKNAPTKEFNKNKFKFITDKNIDSLRRILLYKNIYDYKENNQGPRCIAQCQKELLRLKNLIYNTFAETPSLRQDDMTFRERMYAYAINGLPPDMKEELKTIYQNHEPEFNRLEYHYTDILVPVQS